MRKRPFSVEQARRQADTTPRVRWRRLVMMSQQLGAAAESETSGAQPDRTGVARWSAIDFASEIAQAGAPPEGMDTEEGRRALGLLISAAKAFRDASPKRRRLFARPLVASADLVAELMEALPSCTL
jgi:hypothetical protein